MDTLRKGSQGEDVVLCQQRLTVHGLPTKADGIFGSQTEALVIEFQTRECLIADGIVGTHTWTRLLDSPSEHADWNDFVPLLGPASKAMYSLSAGQIPKAPPGVNFLRSKYIGTARTNCSMFTAYFLGCGFEAEFSKDQWLEWQVAQGSDIRSYRGYGPAVVEEWGKATSVPQGSLPEGGVYLLQTFTTWPKGHSWLVLDYDPETDKMLTLESNTSGSGLNGVGFMDLGPIRSTNAANWKSRVRTTWSSRTRSYSQIFMARLNIDHQSVLDWIAKQ